MTKKEAVENHRKMWRWISKKTFERKRRVWKYEFFEENELSEPINDCFCCEYASQFGKHICVKCPIKWDNISCMDSCYLLWTLCEYSYSLSGYYAYLIANLPERETKDFDIVEEWNIN